MVDCVLKLYRAEGSLAFYTGKSFYIYMLIMKSYARWMIRSSTIYEYFVMYSLHDHFLGCVSTK